uniref:RING-type domain-containing protein n=1 Tax=Macrostomum lignano TaxID=282301 RepID=A0A1I8F571_9PLAT
ELQWIGDHCAVCIEPYGCGDPVRIFAVQYHTHCIDQWLLDQRSCPLCKTDILKACGLWVSGRLPDLSWMTSPSRRRLPAASVHLASPPPAPPPAPPLPPLIANNNNNNSNNNYHRHSEAALLHHHPPDSENTDSQQPGPRRPGRGCGGCRAAGSRPPPRSRTAGSAVERASTMAPKPRPAGASSLGGGQPVLGQGGHPADPPVVGPFAKLHRSLQLQFAAGKIVSAESELQPDGRLGVLRMIGDVGKSGGQLGGRQRRCRQRRAAEEPPTLRRCVNELAAAAAAAANIDGAVIVGATILKVGKLASATALTNAEPRSRSRCGHVGDRRGVQQPGAGRLSGDVGGHRPGQDGARWKSDAASVATAGSCRQRLVVGGVDNVEAGLGGQPIRSQAAAPGAGLQAGLPTDCASSDQRRAGSWRRRIRWASKTAENCGRSKTAAELRHDCLVSSGRFV